MDTQEKSKKKDDLFSQFGKKVDRFIEELNEAGTRLHNEFEERFSELKDSAERIKNEARNKERWKEVEENLKRAGVELKKAFKAAFEKRNPGEDDSGSSTTP